MFFLNWNCVVFDFEGGFGLFWWFKYMIIDYLIKLLIKLREGNFKRSCDKNIWGWNKFYMIINFFLVLGFFKIIVVIIVGVVVFIVCICVVVCVVKYK